MKINFNFDKAVNYMILAIVFLLPLFFLPWSETSIGMDSSNKFLLFWFLVPVSLFLLIFKKVKEKRIELYKTPLDFAIILFLVAAGVSAFFSVDKFSSLFGFYGNFGAPYLLIVGLVTLYFLVVNFVFKLEQFVNIFKVILSLYIFVVSWAAAIILLPKIEYSGIILSSLGSIEDVSVFLAIIDVFIAILILKNEFMDVFCRQKWQKMTVKAFFLLSLVVLVVINFSPAWICLLLGSLFAYFLFFLFQDKGFFEFKKSFFIFLVIFLSVVFLGVNQFVLDSSIQKRRFSQNLQLDYSDSMVIAKQAIKTRPKLGYGQDNFSTAFSLFRDVNLNKDEFWGLRYNRSTSYILELLVTSGVAVLLAYFIILGLAGYFFQYYFRELIKIKNNLDAKQILILIGLCAITFILSAVQFFYTANVVLLFFFWLFLALVISYFRLLSEGLNLSKTFFEKKEFLPKEKKFKFELITLLFFVLFCFWLILSTLELKYWLADYYFKQEINEENMLKAEKLNTGRYNYKVGLAKFYLSLAAQEISKPAQEQDTVLIENNFNKAVNWAKKAIINNPNSVVAHEALAMIYRTVASYSPNYYSLAINTFQTASRLEPSNPVLLTELGKAYLGNEQPREAAEMLKLAFEVKDDYFEGVINLAKAYSSINEFDKALEVLDDLENRFDNPEIFYEKGKVYYNQRNMDLALSNFNKTIEMSPNHSNALYSLGLISEEIGDKKEALYYFEKVLSLNPGNEDVMTRINSLK